MELQFGRMKQLAMELEELEDSYLISFVNKAGDEELHDRNALTVFDVQYSSLTPASKWVVRFEIGRGYPFGEIDVYPISVFGLAPTLSSASLNDAVPHGFGRLARACEFLKERFEKTVQKEEEF